MAGHFTVQSGSSASRPGRSADQEISARAATSGTAGHDHALDLIRAQTSVRAA